MVLFACSSDANTSHGMPVDVLSLLPLFLPPLYPWNSARKDNRTEPTLPANPVCRDCPLSLQQATEPQESMNQEDGEFKVRKGLES